MKQHYGIFLLICMYSMQYSYAMEITNDYNDLDEIIYNELCTILSPSPLERMMEEVLEIERPELEDPAQGTKKRKYTMLQLINDFKKRLKVNQE